MNILLIGSGGREHTFAYKIRQSKHCSKLYIMPGNAGTSNLGQNVSINPLRFNEVTNFCVQHNIQLVIVGPEEPLVKGLRDYFLQHDEVKNIPFIGPDKSGAIIEGSKDWSKSFMEKYKIPTAAYKSFNKNTLQEGIEFINKQALPIVLKADGLAAGKGVLICNTYAEAKLLFEEMLTKAKFGEAGNIVVVEEFLKGIECSVFVLTDGNNYKILPVAKDYKRIGEGDTGLNTGGMGAVCPVPFANKEFMHLVEHNIVVPTVNGLKNEGIKYCGFIFIGLMNVDGNPYVIEYNCRMGDPETEAVLPLIENDFVELMLATANGTLDEIELKINNSCTATVMLVSKGYPEDYEKGKEIKGIDLVNDSIVFQAGTKLHDDKILSNGGRVLAITSFGSTIKQAVENSIKNAQLITFENKYFRKDIGFEFID
ncbi:MAG: phosphoribosylamine--glycine ligase [Bacteroidia bacterium]